MTIGFAVRTDVINKASDEEKKTLHRDWKWIADGTPNRLLKAITKGYAVTPGRWLDSYNRKGVFIKGYKSKYNGKFQESHYVMLDFDNGMSLNDALNNEFIASTASFLYTSPSHMKPGKGERFRIVWCLSTPITNWRDHDDVILALRDRVNHSDDPAINAASCLFGSQPLDDNFFAHIWRGYQNRLDPQPLIDEQLLRRAQKRQERIDLGYEDGDLWEHDKDSCGEDRVALMVHCLKVQEDTGFRYVPDRQPGCTTWSICRDVLFGLVHYFGVEITYQILDEADWYGDNTTGDWDVDRLIEEAAIREESWMPGDKWCSYGTILKYAKKELGDPDLTYDPGYYAPAMPKADFVQFKYNDEPEMYTDFTDEDKDFYNESLREEIAIVQRKDNELDLDKVFPKDLADQIRRMAKTIPAHPDSIALSMLPVIASILGAKHKIYVFNAYYEKFILQTCLLLNAGSRKSAILKLVADELWEWDIEARKAFINDDSEGPRERVQIDSTPEALIAKASKPKNANGFLRRQDELSSLFKSLFQYNNGNGLEQELRLWDGQPIKQARANKDSDRIVDKPCISTVSTSQPKVFTKLVENMGGLEDSANGLWGRWLFIRPPYIKAKAYREDDGEAIGIEFKEALSKLYRNIDVLDGQVWRPTPEAKSKFYDISDARTEQTEQAKNSFMENAYMKAIGHTARIAGILAVIRTCYNNTIWDSSAPYEATITLNDVIGAEHIMDYFVQQAKALAYENTDRKTSGTKAEHGGLLKQLAEWTAKKESQTISARDVQRAEVAGFKGKSADEIREVFQQAAAVLPDHYQLVPVRGKISLKVL